MYTSTRNGKLDNKRNDKGTSAPKKLKRALQRQQNARLKLQASLND